jgi:replicative DNA helicase
MLETLEDKELEMILLNSLVQTDKLTEISELLKAEHFSDVRYGQIYDVIKSCEDRYTKIDTGLVASEIVKKDQELMGLFKTAMGYPAQPNVYEMARAIIDLYNKREYYKLSIQIQQSLGAKKQTGEIVQDIEREINRLNIGTNSMAKSYEEYEKEFESKKTEPIYETKVSFVDSALGGGIEQGQLILIMGDAEAGKTLLSTQILRNVSAGFKTLFFCFEFTIDSFIKQNKAKKREFNKQNMTIINDGYTLDNVVKEIKIFAKEGGKFVLIDSQMRIDNGSTQGTVEQMESEKFSTLAKLCHRLNIIILLIAQQGKEDTKGGVHSPMGSKKGAHEANQIWYIHKLKPKYDEEGNDLNKEVRYFELSKNKQNGRHFKTEIRLNPFDLEFKRKYDKEVEVTEFKSDSQEDIQVEIPDMGLL